MDAIGQSWRDKLDASLTFPTKLTALIALSAAPAIGMWLMLAQTSAGPIDELAREQDAAVVLRQIGEADADASRFLRLGALASDRRLLANAARRLAAARVETRLGDEVDAQARRVVATFESIPTDAESPILADAARNALLELDSLARLVSEVSGLKFDDSIEMRLANAIRLELASPIAGRLEILRRRLEGGSRAEIAEALADADEARMALNDAVISDAGSYAPRELIIESERFSASFDVLMTQASGPRRGRDTIALTRAWRDTAASLDTLRRAALDAMNETLDLRHAELKAERDRILFLTACLIFAFVSAATLAARRLLLAPVARLVDDSAAFATGERALDDTTLLSRADEIGAIARHLAAADIFARRRIQEEADRNAAARARTDRSHFMTMMTHELRTPLNAIIGYGEMLLEDAQARASEDAADLERLLASARGLLAMIGEVLDLALLEADQFEPRDVRFEIEPMVRAVVARVEPDADNKFRAPIKLSFALGQTHLTSDRDRVAQCVYELLSNAVRHGANAPVSVHVETYRRETGLALRVVVSDQGPGVAPNKLKDLFNAFSQSERGHARGHDGLGLGLALTRKLARAMGGDVSVQTAPGKGASFTLWVTDKVGVLPLAIAS